MKLTMRVSVIPLFLITIQAAWGQLNFDGNPLTEDTIYTAEESQLAENAAKGRSLEISDTETDSYLLAAKSLQAERAQNKYQANGDRSVSPGPPRLSTRNEISSAVSSSANSYKTITDEDLKSPVSAPVSYPAEKTHTWNQAYPENAETAHQPEFPEQSDAALAMFLNSKTPEESKVALEEYLGGAQKPSDLSAHHQPHISDIVLPQREDLSRGNEQVNLAGQPELQYPQYAQPEYANPQIKPAQMPFAADRVIGHNANWVNRPVQGMVEKGPAVLRGPPVPYRRRNFVVRPPYVGGIYRAQSRVGPPGFPPGGYGHGAPEIIYTKPPGYHKRYYSKAPNPYEDASAWFPDANHPPPDLNVYHSQLYAQSYDPYYYNYIAKYGKIKPHLYGKYHEHQKESFFSELFKSFKKHGMKHVMHPMFLLGLGIPMVTLMLSALVGKRSFARSISVDADGGRITDEDIDEWIDKLRKALDCYSGSASETEKKTACSVFD
ncbi:uncharacterized protein [Neodiprion pinetum]|uniref:uncharacterized protein isoform X1 n=2 Tax=Neodiprion pinetum TaxID=441929 RepID=UPI001EDE68B8|nr:uncharacterized protein LOC124219909 isoform X1 [Neodiprion pinetum]